MKLNQFTTKVAGIPCICEVTAHYRGKPATRFDEGDDVEFECIILDSKGRRAAWLEKKLTDDDYSRLADEWEATILEHKHMINERYDQ